MADVQLENGYVRIANEIWDEIIRRDFTKRQKDILLLILRLSYGCNKKTAHIPQMVDFSLCGVTKNNIKSELVYLTGMKVIEWDQDAMIFSFNKNYTFWQASPVRFWDEEKFKDLLRINLSGSQNKNSVLKIRTDEFLKQELQGGETPTASKDEEVPKDIIKDTQEEEPRTALEAYTYSFKKFFYTGHIQGYVTELLGRGFTDAFIREVFLEMGARGINADERYMRKLAEDWIVNGIYTRIEAERRREQKKNPSEREAELQQQRAEERKNKVIEMPDLKPDPILMDRAAGFDD